MRNFTLSLLASLSIIGTAAANDTFSMDTNQLREEMLEKMRNNMTYPFELMDIDGNKKLSKTECGISEQDLNLLSMNTPYFSQTDVSEFKQKAEALFNKYDLNKDSFLDEQESKLYFTEFYKMIVDMQLNKMDTDGDGTITDSEMMALMDTMPTMEESLEKLNQAMEKIEEINKNPEQYFSQMMDNTAAAISKEEFVQMDTNKDSKVTEEEYADYMFNHPDNKELELSKQSYKKWYQEIEGSQKGYLTEEEYADYSKKQFEETMTDLNLPK